MNSTNVPSKRSNDQKRNNPVLAGGQTIPTEKGIEIPPTKGIWGISRDEMIQKEEVIEISVGNSIMRPDGTLEMPDGTIKHMEDPKAYQNIIIAKKNREGQKREAIEKTNEEDLRKLARTAPEEGESR